MLTFLSITSVISKVIGTKILPMRRAITRIDIDRPILLQLSNGMTVKARINNISPGGLAILHPAPGELNAVLGLYFQLPDKHNEPVTIQCKGIVRNSYISNSQYITGLEFRNISDYDMQIVENFVNMKMACNNNMLIA